MRFCSQTTLFIDDIILSYVTINKLHPCVKLLVVIFSADCIISIFPFLPFFASQFWYTQKKHVPNQSTFKCLFTTEASWLSSSLRLVMLDIMTSLSGCFIIAAKFIISFAITSGDFSDLRLFVPQCKINRSLLNFNDSFT